MDAAYCMVYRVNATMAHHQDYYSDRIMQMHNPPHPGLILKHTVLRADGGISVTELADRLGVTRASISRLVNGKAAVSPELAIRLEAFMNLGARSWLVMQADFDLWQIRKHRRPRIRRLDAAEIA